MPRRQETERECCLTREVRPVAELMRFVVGPDDVLVPDIDARAEGRGAWVTASAAMVGEAVRRKAFLKSLKAPVTVPADLAELAGTRLEQRLCGALSMAKKAGQIVTGATKVRSAIEKGEIIALFTASDAAPDGRGKMAGALKAAQMAAREAGIPGPDTPHFEMLESAQLGLALGLENVIHAALTTGPAAQGALVRAERLARYKA